MYCISYSGVVDHDVLLLTSYVFRGKFSKPVQGQVRYVTGEDAAHVVNADLTMGNGVTSTVSTRHLCRTKGSICLLYNKADTAFCLCRADLQRRTTVTAHK